MKALVIRQPWASLIASGRKTIELRTWSTNHRGEFTIIAGSKRMTKPQRALFPDLADAPRGVALAIVELVNCRPAAIEDADAACCPVDFGREYAWELRLVQMLSPFAIKGRLGWFDIGFDPRDMTPCLDCGTAISWEESPRFGALCDRCAKRDDVITVPEEEEMS